MDCGAPEHPCPLCRTLGATSRRALAGRSRRARVRVHHEPRRRCRPQAQPAFVGRVCRDPGAGSSRAARVGRAWRRGVARVRGRAAGAVDAARNPRHSAASGAEQEALHAVADVLSRLFDATIPPLDFPQLAEAADRHLVRKLATAGDATEVLAPLIEAARAAARSLASSASSTVLLHGDVMDKNLLRDRDRVLAIDPMPRVGDAHSDLGFWAAMRTRPADLETRASGLARRLGCDPVRASRWAAIYAVGSACETWRRDTRELREWVRSPRAAELLSG